MSVSLDRRQFSVATALALLGGAAITISGCGSGPNDPDPVPANDKPGAVATNHGHEVVLSSAQQTAGAGLTLQFTGTATHVHSVELSAAEVISIRGGTRVSKDSSTTGAHVHTVTFN
jgi:hypothetical protein